MHSQFLLCRVSVIVAALSAVVVAGFGGIASSIVVSMPDTLPDDLSRHLDPRQRPRVRDIPRNLTDAPDQLVVLAYLQKWLATPRPNAAQILAGIQIIDLPFHVFRAAFYSSRSEGSGVWVLPPNAENIVIRDVAPERLADLQLWVLDTQIFPAARSATVFDNDGRSILFYAYDNWARGADGRLIGEADVDSLQANLDRLHIKYNGRISVNTPAMLTAGDGHRALLNVAASEGRGAVVQMLTQRMNAHVDGAEGACWTPLMDALNSGEFYAAFDLLLQGADVNRQCKLSGALNMIGLMRVNSDEQMVAAAAVLKELVNRGVDVNARDSQGRCAALAAAVHRQDNRLVDLLLDEGADSTGIDGLEDDGAMR